MFSFFNVNYIIYVTQYSVTNTVYIFNIFKDLIKNVNRFINAVSIDLFSRKFTYYILQHPYKSQKK